MKATRRGFLAGLSAATLLGCKDGGSQDSDSEPPEGSPSRDPEPPPWAPEGQVDSEVFAWGVQTGDALPDAVLVSLRSTAASVSLELVRGEGQSWVEERTVEALALVDGLVQTELTGLEPDTVYALVARSEDGRSAVSRFRTALAPGQDRRVVFGATSCLKDDNAPFPTLSDAATEDLDLFLLVGDIVYAYETTLEGYRQVYADAFEIEGLQAVMRSTSTISIWDDHEVANNWYLGENVTEPQLAAALQAFREALPQRQGPDGVLWRSLVWGSVLEVFVLDCRGERIHDERYLSPEQMAWIKQALTDSQARFKIVLTTVPITDLTRMFGSVEADDRWQGYPEQREELLLHTEQLPGVLFVAGDLHYGALNHVGPSGELGADQLEVMVGPGGSKTNPAAALFGGDPQFPILLAAWSWTRFTADATLGTVHVAFIGDQGEVLAEELLAL